MLKKSEKWTKTWILLTKIPQNFHAMVKKWLKRNLDGIYDLQTKMFLSKTRVSCATRTCVYMRVHVCTCVYTYAHISVSTRSRKLFFDAVKNDKSAFALSLSECTHENQGFSIESLDIRLNAVTLTSFGGTSDCPVFPKKWDHPRFFFTESSVCPAGQTEER